MPSNRSCSVDTFAIVLEEMLDEYRGEVKAASTKSVRRALKVGRDEAKAGAASHFNSHTGDYVRGWAFTTSIVDDEASGEIGNKLVPGLPHLLEKGHARTGGDRVEGREHIKTARNKAANELRTSLIKTIGGI